MAAAAACLAVAAAVVATRGGEHEATRATPTTSSGAFPETAPVPKAAADAAVPQAGRQLAVPGTALQTVPSSTTRLQRYHASLELRVRTPADVSSATRRALAIAARSAAIPCRGRRCEGPRRRGGATLRIPRQKVQEAVARLSALGTIVSSDVRVEDLEAQVRVTETRIDRLQRRLRELRAQEPTPEVNRRIASLRARSSGCSAPAPRPCGRAVSRRSSSG